MAHLGDGRVFGMGDLDGFVEGGAQHRRGAQQIADRHLRQPSVVGLFLDDGVEVAAIGDVDRDLPEAGTIDGHILSGQIGADVGQAHGLHEAVGHPVVRLNRTGRCLQTQESGLPWLGQAAFQGEGDGADGPMAAHGQAAAGLDIENGHIEARVARRIQDSPGHQIVAARFEHQAGADPVIAAHEVLPPLAHGGAGQRRAAAGDQADRIATCVPVDAEKCIGGRGAGATAVVCHGTL
jgi:hypothetical protein